MKMFRIFFLLVFMSLVISACGQPQLPPRSFTTLGWSTSASTQTELSYSFPGEWNGSSRLPFGEGEFAKDPNQSIGITFQINLSGNPDSLLEAWGKKDVDIVGVVTFVPESVTEAPNIAIARIKTPTKIAEGGGVTAQVAYIARDDDVIEVMWFAPSKQWEALQSTFQGVLEKIELWHIYENTDTGLRTMYVHDWLEPQPTLQDTGLWLRSADERTGSAIFIINEIVDPNQLLKSWKVERLSQFTFTNCTLGEGDGMNTLSGRWTSKMGECTNAQTEKVTYEVSFVPNKDQVIEIITYAPSDTWANTNERAFAHFLSLMSINKP